MSELDFLHPFPWDDFPMDVRGYILSFLSPTDLIQARLVCRGWKNIVSRVLTNLKFFDVLPSRLLPFYARTFPNLNSLELSEVSNEAIEFIIKNLTGLIRLEIGICPLTSLEALVNNLAHLTRISVGIDIPHRFHMTGNRKPLQLSHSSLHELDLHDSDDLLYPMGPLVLSCKREQLHLLAYDGEIKGAYMTAPYADGEIVALRSFTYTADPLSPHVLPLLSHAPHLQHVQMCAYAAGLFEALLPVASCLRVLNFDGMDIEPSDADALASLFERTTALEALFLPQVSGNHLLMNEY